jgi:hypothetical protein
MAVHSRPRFGVVSDGWDSHPYLQKKGEAFLPRPWFAVFFETA